jgi:hypothetical protein
MTTTQAPSVASTSVDASAVSQPRKYGGVAICRIAFSGSGHYNNRRKLTFVSPCHSVAVQQLIEEKCHASQSSSSSGG